MTAFTVTGSGTHALTAGTGQLHVHIDILPSNSGLGSAEPTNYFKVGQLRAGDGSAWWRPEPIDATDCWMGVPDGATQLGYSIDPGGQVTVTEVALSNPFVGPVGPAGSAGSSATSDYLLYEERQTSGTTSPAFTTGGWRTRALNTEVSDPGGHGTLASNQVTLQAGTYRCVASAPGVYVGVHQARLRDITNGITLLVGTSEFTETSGGGQSVRSVVQGIFTLAASTILELQHRCSISNVAGGMGLPCGFGESEVYAVLELHKDS